MPGWSENVLEKLLSIDTPLQGECLLKYKSYRKFEFKFQAIIVDTNPLPIIANI